MALSQGELVEVEQKDNEGTGWCLVKKQGKTGWAPTAYLEEQPLAKAGPAKRAPPPPPAANGNARHSQGEY
jgi:myosin-1